MARGKTPLITIEAIDDKDLDALQKVYGSKINVDGVDSIDKMVHDLTHHKYQMPCGHDIEEVSGPCRQYSPDAADRFSIAYYGLVQARSELDSAKSAANKVKFSLKYVKSHEAFSAAERAAAKAIQRGIEKRAEERKERDAFAYR